jgi:hypothetical protein
MAGSFGTTEALGRPLAPDGGFAAVATSPEHAKEFLSLIMRGDYIVTFRRSDRAEETVYAVRPPPPQDVREHFLSCAKHL